jgi:hypothetical protein
MKIAVHRFEVWDSVSDTMKSSIRYATVDAIKNTAHGVPIPGTEILVESSELGGGRRADLNPVAQLPILYLGV